MNNDGDMAEKHNDQRDAPVIYIFTVVPYNQLQAFSFKTRTTDNVILSEGLRWKDLYKN